MTTTRFASVRVLPESDKKKKEAKEESVTKGLFIKVCTGEGKTIGTGNTPRLTAVGSSYQP